MEKLDGIRPCMEESAYYRRTLGNEVSEMHDQENKRRSMLRKRAVKE
jgi:hypothetical protein